MSIGESSAEFLICGTFLQNRTAGNCMCATLFTDRDGGLDRFLGLSTTWIDRRRWDKILTNRSSPALRRAPTITRLETP
jgi:hypothetical protein